MSTIDGLLLFWLLPSLVTLQLLIICNRVWEEAEPRDYSDGVWIIMLIFAIIYPFGILCIVLNCLIIYSKDILSKEIKFKRD